MNFYNTIDKIIRKNDLNIDSMVKPINIIISSGNVNYINLELESNKEINDILKDKITHPAGLFLTWIDKDGIITSAGIDSLSMFSLSKNDEIQTDYLSNYQDAGIADNKYHIYLGKALEYELELDLHGYLCKYYHDESEKQNYTEDEIVIPYFKDTTYQKLYDYDNEDDFVNAIMFECLFRNIEHNQILYKHKLEYEDDGSEYEMKTDEELQKYYGIDLFTFTEIQPIPNLLFSKVLTTEFEGAYCLLKSPPSVDINLNLDQPLEELIKKVTTEKENYENELNSSLSFKNILNENYYKSINEILNSFPKSFKKKQDNVIKALYILDYVNARDAQIDIYNKKDEDKLNYPVKRLDGNSVFKEKKITTFIKAGQAKKLYYHIKKILHLPNPL